MSTGGEEETAPHTQGPAQAGWDAGRADRETTEPLAAVLERLHSRLDHTDDRLTESALKVIASVAPSLLLVLAVAQYIKPNSYALAAVDSNNLWRAVICLGVAFGLALLVLLPRSHRMVDGYFVEAMVDGSEPVSIKELLAQEANEAGSRLTGQKLRGWFVFLSVVAYAAGAAFSAAYLYTTATSK